MSKSPALDAPIASEVPIASDVPALVVADQALSELRAEAGMPPSPEATPLTQEMALPNGVVLPPGFVPPPGFDASAFKPVVAPAPVIPSVEELMAMGERSVASDVAMLEDSGTSGFEPWINNPTYEDGDDVLTVPEGLPELLPERTLREAVVPEAIAPVQYDIEAPAFVQAALEMNLTPAELAALLTDAPPQQEATPPADPMVATPPTANELALQARLEQMEKVLAELGGKQAQEAQAQALAQQEAERSTYEATQRASYEAQFEYMDDETREALVEAKVEADLLRWDAQSAQSQAKAQAQALAQQQQEAQRDAVYSASVEQIVRANPTMALEVAQGYRLVDFVADTHRAACDAYGASEIGEFAPYFQAFEKAIKDVQTRAVQHGIALAQARVGKSETSPPVLSNRGGGGPATKPPIAESVAIRPGQNQLFAHLRSPQARR